MLPKKPLHHHHFAVWSLCSVDCAKAPSPDFLFPCEFFPAEFTPILMKKRKKYGVSTSEGHHLEVQRSALQGSSYLARVRRPWAKRHQRLQKAAKLLYITTGARVCANDSGRLWKIGQQQFWNLWIVSFNPHYKTEKCTTIFVNCN